MFCQNCGEELANSVKFCTNCGFSIQSFMTIKEGNEKSITIPSGVTRISPRSYKGTNIESILFEGTSLQSIDEEAFADCRYLKSALIPYGVVQIGDRAFSGCKEMQYIRIPSSVLLIGENILEGCNRDLVIIGKKGTEAERIANAYRLSLQTDETRTIQAVHTAAQSRSGAKTETFEILGESITCSNTLAKYQAAIEYYAGRKDVFFKEYYRQFPSTLSAIPGNVIDTIDSEVQRTVDRLAGQGVLTTKRNIEARYLSDIFDYTAEALKKLLEFRKLVTDETVSDIENKREQLASEAESKVTGLSYGILGDSLDLLVYSIDDFRERQRQRKAAYEVANQKYDQYKKSQLSKGEKTYADLFKQITPSIQKISDFCVEQLRQAEIDLLEESGIISKNALTGIDPQKSAQIIQSIANSKEDFSFTAVLAIQKYPCNVSALTYVLEHNPSCEQIKELIQFLGLSNQVQNGLQLSRQRRVSNYINELETVKTANQGIALINREIGLFADNDVKQMLECIAQAITPKILDIAYEEKEYLITETEAYCRKEIEHILSENDWNYFAKYTVKPIRSQTIPEFATIAYSSLIKWLSGELSKKMDRKKDYMRYLQAYPLLNERAKLQNEKKSLLNERNKCKIVRMKPPKIIGLIGGCLALLISLVVFVGVFGNYFQWKAKGILNDERIMELLPWFILGVVSLISGLFLVVFCSIKLKPNKANRRRMKEINKEISKIDMTVKEIASYPSFEQWIGNNKTKALSKSS